MQHEKAAVPELVDGRRLFYLINAVVVPKLTADPNHRQV
jgi:hypothetical protein